MNKAGEIRQQQFAMLQAVVLLKRSELQVGDTLQRKRASVLPLFVFLQRLSLRPQQKTRGEVFFSFCLQAVNKQGMKRK